MMAHLWAQSRKKLRKIVKIVLFILFSTHHLKFLSIRTPINVQINILIVPIGQQQIRISVRFYCHNILKIQLLVFVLIPEIMDQCVQIDDFRPIVQNHVNNFVHVVNWKHFILQINSSSEALLLGMGTLDRCSIENQLNCPCLDVFVALCSNGHGQKSLQQSIPYDFVNNWGRNCFRFVAWLLWICIRHWLYNFWLWQGQQF